MKSVAPKPSQKSPYNNPPVKLRAQIIPQKLIDNKKLPIPQQQSQSQSSNESSSYDSEVQDFANQFYDQEVKNADKSLEQKKDEDINPNPKNGSQGANKQNSSSRVKKSKKPQTQLDRISSRLKQLKGNFADLDMDSLLFKKKDENKLKQIAQFLSKKHKEKRDFMKKLKKIKNSQKQRRKVQQQMVKKKQKQEHQNRLKEIRSISKMIKQKIQKKKQQQQDRLQDIQAFYQQFHKKYKNHKIYKLMQLSDKKRRHKQYQKQQQYLKQRRNVVSQIISAKQIIEFNKRRQQYLKDSYKVKQTQKEQRSEQINKKNRELRQKIYISNRYMQMQEQLTQRQKIRSIPRQKMSRIKKYNQHIKQHFMPINNTKDEENEQDNGVQKGQYLNEDDEIVQIDGRQYRKVKKDRYLKGVKVGEMIVKMRVAKSQKEQRLVGNSYLQQVKLLPKKRYSTSLDMNKGKVEQQYQGYLQKSQTLKQKSLLTPHRVLQIPKISSTNRQMGKIRLSNNPNRHQIQNLINSLKAKDEVISRQHHYLKVVKKGNDDDKDDVDDKMIDNIEKKINLLGRL